MISINNILVIEFFLYMSIVKIKQCRPLRLLYHRPCLNSLHLYRNDKFKIFDVHIVQFKTIFIYFYLYYTIMKLTYETKH